jgi:hypothetical protein
MDPNIFGKNIYHFIVSEVSEKEEKKGKIYGHSKKFIHIYNYKRKFFLKKKQAKMEKLSRKSLDLKNFYQ